MTLRTHTTRLVTASLLVTLGTLMNTGCRKEDPPAEQELKIPVMDSEQPADYVIIIVYDLSGSFEDNMIRNGKAWKMSLKILEKFRSDLPNAHARVVISHISGNDTNPIIWSGSLTDMKKGFSSPDEFREYLDARRGPHGSCVYGSIRKTLDDVLALPDIQDGTPSVLLVFSDMEDDNLHDPEAKNSLLARLRSYSITNSAVGLYWVTETAPAWEKHLEDTGFKGRSTVQREFEAVPPMPSFR